MKASSEILALGYSIISMNSGKWQPDIHPEDKSSSASLLVSNRRSETELNLAGNIV
ncbi:6205_t:CDS:1, partial [Ambispora gerdemannii]